jgi:polysaccharide pyruvyl transferase WcaK-like protein
MPRTSDVIARRRPGARPTLQPVFLAGAFGQGNPGDEALLEAFARSIGDRPVTAVSSAPADTAAGFGVGAVARDDLVAVGRAVARADAVVLAGGTLFKTLHPSSGRRPLALLRRAATLTAAARAARKPVALVGVGAAALEGRAARSLARSVVHSADLLVLRDEESAELLAGIGAPAPLRVGADPVWTLLPEPPPPRRSGAGVAVALSHLAGGRELAGRLGAALRRVRDAGVPVRLVPWQDGAGGADRELATAVAAHAGAEVLEPPRDLAAARRMLAGHATVLGLRFHALMAAASAGVPFVGYAHEPKLAGLARRLRQPTVRPDAAPAELATAVLGSLHAAAAAPVAVAAERGRAEEAFRLLRVLLSRGRTDEAATLDGLPLRPQGWVS